MENLYEMMVSLLERNESFVVATLVQPDQP